MWRGAMEVFMRVHHVVAFIIAIVLGLAVKQSFFHANKAEAGIAAGRGPAVDVMELQKRAPSQTPAQDIHDMTFIFSGD